MLGWLIFTFRRGLWFEFSQLEVNKREIKSKSQKLYHLSQYLLNKIRYLIENYLAIKTVASKSKLLDMGTRKIADERK